MKWLIPKPDNLHGQWRIALGVLTNIVFAIYAIPIRERLCDIQDYQYVKLNLKWEFGMALIPLLVLMVLLPVVASKNIFHRWIAIALSILPAFRAVATWIQLAEIWL